MGLSRGDIIQIDNQSIKALQEFLVSCTVIITSEAEVFDHRTGVAVRYGNQDYILTAAHVLNGEPENEKIKVIGRPEVPVRDVQKDQLSEAIFSGSPSQLAFSTATHINIERRLVGKDAEDIAALKVQDADKDLPHTVFHNLSDQGETLISVGTPVNICGIPGELARQGKHRLTGQRGYAGFAYLDQLEIREISDAPGHLDPDVYFLTDFIYNDQTCNPRGMSGCGVWSIPSLKDGQLWFPNKSQLLGIQIGHYPERKRLQIVRIERVLDLLSSGGNGLCT